MQVLFSGHNEKYVDFSPFSGALGGMSPLSPWIHQCLPTYFQGVSAAPAIYLSDLIIVSSHRLIIVFSVNIRPSSVNTSVICSTSDFFFSYKNVPSPPEATDGRRQEAIWEM